MQVYLVSTPDTIVGLFDCDLEGLLSRFHYSEGYEIQLFDIYHDLQQFEKGNQMNANT